MPITGIDTDKHSKISANINQVEKNMIDKLKSHYNFTTDRQLLVALIKRAYLHIDK